MRILHVITSVNRGGAENHLIELATSQAAQGHDVRIAYLKGDSYWRAHLDAQGIPTTYLACGGMRRPIAAAALAKLIRGSAPDVLHAHLPRAEISAYFALRRVRDRPIFVISKHNDDPFHANPMIGALGRRIASAADRVIAISDSVRIHACCAGLGLPESKVETIYYGLTTAPYDAQDAAATAALRAAWCPGQPAPFIVGTVARLVPQKALERLLRGFAAYLRLSASPAAARLVIVGTGPLETTLKREAERLGVTGQVVWAGFRSDIPQVMASFDVFALTSLYEGLGLVLLEAMAAKVPVVASNVSAMPEIVAQGSTGLLLDTADTGALATALHAYEDGPRRRLHGEAGRRRVDERFTVATMTQATMAAYERAAQTGHAPPHKALSAVGVVR